MKANYWTVYQLVDDNGEVFYIGCTRNLTQRIQAHRARFRDRSWQNFTAEVFANKRAALDREASLIESLQPEENLVHRFVPRLKVEGSCTYYRFCGSPAVLERQESRVGLKPFWIPVCEDHRRPWVYPERPLTAAPKAAA